jgi:hypothetical protein
MPKHKISTRLIDLMNRVCWEDYSDWNSINSEATILEFEEWIICVLPYLPNDVRDIAEGYYLHDLSGNVRDGYYLKLEKARTALSTLYSYIRSIS